MKCHLEDRHIVLDTADTVSGQLGQCDCSVSPVGTHWMARLVLKTQEDTQTCQDTDKVIKVIE